GEVTHALRDSSARCGLGQSAVQSARGLAQSKSFARSPTRRTTRRRLGLRREAKRHAALDSSDGARNRSAFHSRREEIQSAVAAALCRRSPKDSSSVLYEL